MSRRIRALIIGTVTAVLVSSCASISVNSMPLPGRSYSDGYVVVLEFANVLNLPDQAKVVQDGTTIGVVKRIELMSEHVDVISQINKDVVIPSNARATLQQSTVLGDTYVALERPVTDTTAAAVPVGGRIPLAQTTSPPQLEDTIAYLANFAGSGSIQRAQNTIIGLNSVTPDDRADLRSLVTRVTADLTDLSNDIGTVDQWLQGVSGTADVIHRHVPIYEYWWSPTGMMGFDRTTQVATYMGTVIPSIGSIYAGGFWLVPLLESMGEAAGAVQQSKWDFEREGPAWRKLFTENVFPVDKYPAINITSITGPDGKEMINNVEDVLRILGAVP